MPGEVNGIISILSDHVSDPKAAAAAVAAAAAAAAAPPPPPPTTTTTTHTHTHTHCILLIKVDFVCRLISITVHLNVWRC